MEKMIMNDVQHPRTYLFTVRVWLEELGDGKTEWRGQVKHVTSGEAQYFREWSNLITTLQEMLAVSADENKDA